MATQNLDSADLKKNANGVLVNEDLMQQVWDISRIPLPYTDRAGSADPDQEFTEWLIDELPVPDLTNAKVDGADATGNDTSIGKRMGNHCQISTKTIRVSTRANVSDSSGDMGTLEYQTVKAMRSLKRDIEAISLSLQGSVEDDGDTIAGKAGSVFSFIKTHSSVGATGSVPGYNFTTKLTGTVVPGTKRPFTETMFRDMLQLTYEDNGDPDTLMARPGVIRLISEYAFTSTARIATLTSDTGQGTDASTAKGAVNVWVSDFDIVIKLVPNRMMQRTGGTAALPESSIGLFDFTYIKQGFLWGPRQEALAKTGTADNRLLAGDWTTKVMNEKALAAFHAIDEKVPMTLA
jgi:hypothetical protein